MPKLPTGAENHVNHMDRVISLFGDESYGVTPEDLVRETLATATQQRVATHIMELCQLDQLVDVSTVPVMALTPNADYPRGVVTHGDVKGIRTVVTDINFPRSLVRYANIPPQTAVTIAADFAYAYGYIVPRLNAFFEAADQTLAISGSPFDEHLWPVNFSTFRLLALPFRAAAAVALYGQGIKARLGGDIPFPAHLAGLANPLRDEAMVDFGQIFN